MRFKRQKKEKERKNRNKIDTNEMLYKLKQKQKLFQTNDDELIH